MTRTTTLDQNDSNGAPDTSNERRSFIRRAFATAAIAALYPQGLFSKGSGILSACDPTSTDLYGSGPFYSAGAPYREVLAPLTEPGQRLFVSGIVRANDCQAPLPNVLVDVWHADDSGCYSRFQDCENLSGPEDYKLRGRILTDSQGRFAFESVKPGFYLNGAQYRPSHIHFKVVAPGTSELITQLYFAGDPYIPNDLAASHPNAATRIIPLTQEASGLHGTFDVVLDIPPPISGTASIASNFYFLRQNWPNPVQNRTTIMYHLEYRGEVQIAVFDVSGRRVRSLVNRIADAGAHTIEWDATDDRRRRLPKGVYSYRIVSGTFVQIKWLVIE